MSNPFVCNCALKWLRDFLKNNNLATGNPKCHRPEKLKDQSISGLNDADFRCVSDYLLVNGNEDDEQCEWTSSQVQSKKKQQTNMPSVSDNVLEKNSNVPCPVNCTCLNEGAVVRCSHAELKQIPLDIPVNVQELYLDSNYITEIPKFIKNFVNLEKLYVLFNVNIFHSSRKKSTFIDLILSHS